MKKYQFESIIRLYLKGKICRFHYVSQSTQCLLDFAQHGTLDLEIHEPFAFLDDRMIHRFPTEILSNGSHAFFGYSKSQAFIEIKDTHVISIHRTESIQT